MRNRTALHPPGILYTGGCRDPSLSLEELEARLEAQVVGLPSGLDDANCVYYLCTTRCTAPRCSAFCTCDVVVEIAGGNYGI